MAEIAEPPPQTESSAQAPKASSAFFSALSSELTETPATPEPKAEEPKNAESEAPKTESKKAPDDRRAPSEAFDKTAGEETKATVEAEKKSEIDTIPDPKFKNEDERKNFTTLRQKAKEYESKVSALEARIAEAEIKGKSTEALETKLKEIEAKNAELSEVVSLANVEALPEFRQKYVDGRRKLVEAAQSIISDNGGDANAIEIALSLKGKARVDALREVVDDMPGFQQGIFGQVIRELDVLDGEAAQARSKSGEYWKEYQKRQEQQQEEAQKDEIRRVHESYEQAKKRLSSELEVLRPLKKEGMEWWDKQADEILNGAKTEFTEKWTFQTAAEAAIKARACDVYRELFAKEREYADKEIPARDKRIAELESELKGIYAKSPSMAGARVEANGAPKKGFFDILSEEMPGA